MSRIAVAGLAVSVAALLWMAIASGTPALVWVVAFGIAIGAIAAVTIPWLRRPVRLAREARGATDAPLIVGMVLPGTIALAREHGWHGRLTARLSPVVLATENHGIDVWLEPGAPAFVVDRHAVSQVGQARTVGVDGQEVIAVMERGRGSLVAEFGPWLALVARQRESLKPVATDARSALALFADYPHG